jgi:hypothetical protein
MHALTIFSQFLIICYLDTKIMKRYYLTTSIISCPLPIAWQLSGRLCGTTVSQIIEIALGTATPWALWTLLRE